MIAWFRRPRRFRQKHQHRITVDVARFHHLAAQLIQPADPKLDHPRRLRDVIVGHAFMCTMSAMSVSFPVEAPEAAKPNSTPASGDLILTYDISAREWKVSTVAELQAVSGWTA